MSGLSQVEGCAKLDGQSLATLQQAPLVALQQKPFMQPCPVTHSFAAAQAVPSGLRPTQVEPLQ